MADQEDVRRIALSLPGVREAEDRFAFTVEREGRQKGFAWVWMERVDPRQPRVPNPDVLAVRVRDEADKAMLVAGDPERFFTEPHYRGFPAVLVRLRAVSVAQLRTLLADAWACQAQVLHPRRARPDRRRAQRAGRRGDGLGSSVARKRPV
jgi:hypothetical protein